MDDIVARAHVPAPGTVGSSWESIEAPIPWDQAVTWPPDVFAFTDLLLSRTEAYRFVFDHPTMNGSVLRSRARGTLTVSTSSL